MTTNRKADLQRKLSMTQVPEPPPGLADRIKAEIPQHLGTAAGGAPRKTSPWSARNLQIAASIMLLISALYVVRHFSSRSASLSKSANDVATHDDAAPARTTATLPTIPPEPGSARTQAPADVPLMPTSPPPTSAATLPATRMAEARRSEAVGMTTGAPAYAQDRLERNTAGGSTERKTTAGGRPEQNAAASGAPAASPAGARERLSVEPKTESITVLNATANVADDAAPRPAPAAKIAAAPAPPAPLQSPPATSRRAVTGLPGPPPPLDQPVTPVPVSEPVATAATDERPMEEQGRLARERTLAKATAEGTAQKKDVPRNFIAVQQKIARGETLGYLDTAAVVQHFAAPEHVPSELHVELEASSAPLDATKWLLRVSTDAPERTAARVALTFGEAVAAHRAAAGSLATNATALYEIELKPTADRDQLIATVTAAGATSSIRVADLHPWKTASTRMKRASLASAWAQTRRSDPAREAIAAKAREAHFDDLAEMVQEGGRNP